MELLQSCNKPSSSTLETLCPAWSVFIKKTTSPKHFLIVSYQIWTIIDMTDIKKNLFNSYHHHLPISRISKLERKTFICWKQVCHFFHKLIDNLDISMSITLEHPLTEVCAENEYMKILKYDTEDLITMILGGFPTQMVKECKQALMGYFHHIWSPTFRFVSMIYAKPYASNSTQRSPRHPARSHTSWRNTYNVLAATKLIGTDR